ncbi:Gti1/Pac2 family-domain-containing protein, partial [Pholiota molesta]
MSAAQQAQSANAWTEPPWSGWIETTGDALLILEAARRGLIPRVTRRLVDSERKMITSGSVFVFDEDESGIKRWTDGFFWSPSRILGNFLLYRETDKRGAGHRTARADQDLNDAAVASASFGPDGARLTEAQSLSRPKTDNTGLSVDKQRERTLMGSLTNSYKFKPDGLMKKTFSVTIGGVAQHLISYYKIEDVENGRLRSPSPYPSSPLSTSAQNISTRPTSATRPRSRSAWTACRATAARRTTSRTRPPSSARPCPRACRFSPRAASRTRRWRPSAGSATSRTGPRRRRSARAGTPARAAAPRATPRAPRTAAAAAAATTRRPRTPCPRRRARAPRRRS